VLGAIITFVLYGLGPVALVLYIMGTPARKRAIKARERPSWRQRKRRWAAPADSNSVRQMLAPQRPLTRSRRCEKNREGLGVGAPGRCAIIAKNLADAQAARRWRARPARSASHLPARALNIGA
jgi:hypothetical protein